MPDSTSSVALTRGRSRSPLAWSRKNTAAASVEAITAPTSSASVQFSPSAQAATGAVSAAVIRTPTVASRPAGASTLRKVAKPGAQAAVEQDQAERHRADRVGEPHVVELDAADAGFAGQHADQQEDQQQRRAEAQRDQARHDAGQHQHGAEQDGDADGVESMPSRALHINLWRRQGRNAIFNNAACASPSFRGAGEPASPE